MTHVNVNAQSISMNQQITRNRGRHCNRRRYCTEKKQVLRMLWVNDLFKKRSLKKKSDKLLKQSIQSTLRLSSEYTVDSIIDIHSSFHEFFFHPVIRSSKFLWMNRFELQTKLINFIIASEIVEILRCACYWSQRTASIFNEFAQARRLLSYRITCRGIFHYIRVLEIVRAGQSHRCQGSVTLQTYLSITKIFFKNSSRKFCK